jgi:hypothetical protein
LTARENNGSSGEVAAEGGAALGREAIQAKAMAG